MSQPANPMDSYPYPIKAASCPLLVAVLPLRYAIGPNRGFDAAMLGLPALEGAFPALGARYKIDPSATLNYSRRLLRDGWLYLWTTHRRVLEFQVSGFLLTQTTRGGVVVDKRQLPYLILPAGEPAMLAWSPVKWSDAQFQAAKNQEAVRQRVMRGFTPGAGPYSGPTGITEPRDTPPVGDYLSPDSYAWSCEPETGKRPDWIKTHFAMGHCEQQAWVAVDDPWGVALDLAALLRTCKQRYDSVRRRRGEDWAMANVLRSLERGDEQLGRTMRDITDYPKLVRTWQEQDATEFNYAEDVRRLSELWATWFDTLRSRGVATLDTACGHFDITQPASRDALEQHFAAACLGPAETSAGIKAIAPALAPAQAPAKPWLLWSLLGLTRRLGPGELKQLLDAVEGAKGSLPNAAEASEQMARALALSAALNAGASRLASYTPARAQEPLFAALAPVAATRARSLPETADDLLRYYTLAALGRSGQRLDVLAATEHVVGDWLGSLVNTNPAAPRGARKTPIATAVEKALPMLRLVPANDPGPTIPKPGYGSPTPTPTPTSSVPSVPVHGGGATTRVTAESVLDLSKDALKRAPLKSLIAVVAAVNVGVAIKGLYENKTGKSALDTAGGAFGTATAVAGVVQRLGELDWEAAVRTSGEFSAESIQKLERALGQGMATQFAQSLTSSVDILIFGYEAIDAYRVGDFDTAAINAGLTVASAGQLALAVKAYRAYRAARLAVMMGQLAAIRVGTSVVGGWVGALTLGLTTTVLAGLLARSYTQNTPLEKWVAQTRFGVKPADWASRYSDEMRELYKTVFPFTFNLGRLVELHPYKGHIETTWLILRLPGQTRLQDWMIHFKGVEVWDNHGWFGLRDIERPVEWTGNAFEADIGTRRPHELGVARYRKLYHEEKDLGQIKKIKGTLTYSPLPGVSLPSIEVDDVAWL
ncbi:toxin VasX [Pseudomonas indica]|uniref:toxin VasX n=1 Tax=Pseudomonas indica TaxID=137658 RepID=UPI003FD55282